MKAPSCYLIKTMKCFSIEKVLKTGPISGSESRLGTIRLSNLGVRNGDQNSIADNKCTVADDNGSRSATGNSDANDITYETFSYRTPMYLIHTQTGSIPHVTPEVLMRIYPSTPSSVATAHHQIPPVQISMDSTIKYSESIGKFGKGIGKYVGLPDVPTFVTVHDSLQPLKTGHNDKFGIALWSRHGRTSLTPERFVETLKSFKPSLGQILSDYDVRAESSGMKRLKKSTSRAEEYSSFVIKEMSSSKSQRTGMFITIEASWFQMNEEIARKAVTSLLESQDQFEGVIIAGLSDRFAKSEPKCNDSKRAGEPHKLDFCEGLDTELIDQIVKILPAALPKYVPGPFQLPQMIDLISKGVDILDSSCATKMADDAEAILLDDVEAILVSLTTSVKTCLNAGNETLPTRCEETNDTSQTKTVEGSVISLKEKRFFDDFRPLSNYCTCYTCRKHTRSYVHHLYATDELLGPVLIQIHNLTAIDRFFQVIRGILDDTDNPESILEKLSILKENLKKSSQTEIAATLSCNYQNDMSVRARKKS